MNVLIAVFDILMLFQAFLTTVTIVVPQRKWRLPLSLPTSRTTTALPAWSPTVAENPEVSNKGDL